MTTPGAVSALLTLPAVTVVPVAQPVTLCHHLLAYFEMFDRDRNRGRDCRKRLNECPLGAAALAGTSFPLDRRATARHALGKHRAAAQDVMRALRIESVTVPSSIARRPLGSIVVDDAKFRDVA